MKVEMFIVSSINGVARVNNKRPFGAEIKEYEYLMKISEGCPILMDLKTWESMDNTPIVGRHNIIMTPRARALASPLMDVTFVLDWIDARSVVDQMQYDKIIILHGPITFSNLISICEKVHLAKYFLKVREEPSLGFSTESLYRLWRSDGGARETVFFNEKFKIDVITRG